MTETAKKAPAKKAAEPKSAVKRAQGKQVKAKAAKKTAAKKTVPKALSRKEQMVADHPVNQSGLHSITHDELNPAYALKTK